MAAPSSARRSGSVSERSFGRQATRATHVQREDCTRSAMQAYLGEWMIPLEVHVHALQLSLRGCLHCVCQSSGQRAALIGNPGLR